MANKVLNAKFRGITFYFDSVSMSGGQAYVNHEFVGSNRTFVEQTGLKTFSYSFDAYVSSDNVVQDKKTLLNAFKKGGNGILIHPFDGSLFVKVGDFSFTDSLSSVGKIRFSVNFLQDNGPSQDPVVKGGTPEQLAAKRNSAQTEAAAGMAGGYKKPSTFSGVSTAFKKVSDISSKTLLLKTETGIYSDKIASFNQAHKSYSASAAGSVASPTDLSDKTKSIFVASQGLYEDPEVTLAAHQKLFTFGDNDPLIVNNKGNERIFINNNIKVINDTVQAYALINAFDAASNIIYDNNLIFNATKNNLQAQLSKLLASHFLTSTLKRELQDLYNFFIVIVSAQNIAQVVTEYFAKPVSLKQLSYLLYGNLSFITPLRALNNGAEIVFGDVKVLSL